MKTFSQNIVILNRNGYVIGPLESLNDFFARVQYLIDDAPEHPTYIPDYLKDLFDINPEYVRIIYSNDGIGVWEGACTWIAENEVAIQLRKSLEKKKRLYYFYDKEELIAHEMVHVVRAKFQEKEFEEILAYSTSRSRLRRFFGPIFRNPGETYVCLLSLLVFVVLLGLYPSLGFLCFAGTVGFFCGRLVRLQSIFFKARSKIKTLFGVNPYPVLLRLTDREIRLFAEESREGLINYMDANEKKEARWKQIIQSYFLKMP